VRWGGRIDCWRRGAGEIAQAEKVTRSFKPAATAKLLAPDIQEAILNGRQPKKLQLEDVTQALPSTWHDQRQRLLAREAAGFSTAAPRRASTQRSVADPIAGMCRTAGKRRRRTGEVWRGTTVIFR
jgi:hypothetical protein